MTAADAIYRTLQQHLDDQAVGFPSVRSGADIRLLKRLFTPEEATLALHLTFRPRQTEPVAEQVAPRFSAEQCAAMLESMFQKGAIGWKRKNGLDHWFVMPMVVGIYECQDGNPSPEFLQDADAYMKTLSFGRSFLSVKPSQMRTIPINRSIPVEHHIATYDQVRDILRTARGPFVVLPCICRKSEAMKGKPCGKVAREETCLAFGDMAAMVLRRKHGREICRDEVLAILEKNQEDGLVLQPSNTQVPEFVCSCCGCCCGMLAYQKFLPRPVDYWSSSFFAEVSAEACVQCAACADRCQVGAIGLTGPRGEAMVDRNRCIGCGLCAPTCPARAIGLRARLAAPVPPRDEEALGEEIRANRPGAAEQWKRLMKAALRMKP